MREESSLGNKETFGKNLQKYMDERNVSRKDLADHLNVAYSTLSDWINANKYPRIDSIEMLANYFGIDKSDLIEDKSLPNDPNIIPLTPAKRIPILGEIACGEPILAQENFDGYFLADPTLVGGDFVLRCTGDSMIDANIFEDDLVFIKKTPDVENGSIAAVLIDDTATLKRIYKNDTEIILQPENKKYNPIIITEEDMKDVRILGQMTGVFSRRDR